MSTSLDASANEILRFEAAWPQHTAAKEQQIAARWGLTAVRYYQVLARISSTPAALATDPLLAARIRRQRAGRVPMLRKPAEHSGLGSVASSGAFELPA